MSFATRSLQGASGFTPTTHSYPTPGSGTETVPIGATRCVITLQASGSGGFISFFPSQTLGGNAGGYTQKTIAVVGGNTMAFALGTPSNANSGAAGNSNIFGTVSGGSVNMIATGGGAANGGGGGNGTGGDTNLRGGSGDASGHGGVSPYGPGFGNGGSDISAGQPGIATFAYT